MPVVAERLAATLTFSAGAVVMGTGIVSVALSLDGDRLLSLTLLAIAAVGWFALGLGLVVLVIRLRPLLLDEARSPASLTAVAGTAVLGARLQLLGWNREADALLAIALGIWLLLLPVVLMHSQTPAVGLSFLLTVSTESLIVLSATLADVYDSTWLALAALGGFALGLGFYAAVVSSFDPRQLLVGRGDHWIAGGALAIATLACARITVTTSLVQPLHRAHDPLTTASLALWAAAIAWLPPLLVSEVAAPRFGYDVRRWSTVFPLGMYAVCSFAVARACDISGIADFARAWIWVAFTVWLVSFAHLARQAPTALSTSLHVDDSEAQTNFG